MKEFLGPSNLIIAYVFDIYELTEVVVVHKDKKLIFVTLQIVAPSFKSFNNSQKLLVMSLIINLGKDLFLKKKSYKVLLTNFRFRKM